MVEPLNELTTSQLQNLKIRLQSIVMLQDEDIKNKQKRLNERLERQSDGTETLSVLEESLADAIDVRDELIATNGSAAALAKAEKAVTYHQNRVDTFEQESSFLTPESAHVRQSEIDESVCGRQQRIDKIAAIDALLMP